MISVKFKALAFMYLHTQVEFPALREITLAQWALESGYGTSKLAQEHNNFAGMKWRTEMEPYGNPHNYVAHDGVDAYVSFTSLQTFIAGYWKFIDRAPYDGWRSHANDPRGYIEWLKKCGYATDPNYVAKVIAVVPEIQKLLATLKAEPSEATWFRVHALTPDVGLEALDSESRTVAVWRGTNVEDALTFIRRFSKALSFRPAGFVPWPGPPWDDSNVPKVDVPPLTGKRVALDVGHGYTTKNYDSGATGPHGEHEYKLNTVQANAAAAYLRELGCEVDVFNYDEPSDAIGLEKRGERGKGYDCMVSCHFNAADKKAEYASCFCHPLADYKSLNLGRLISGETCKVRSTRNVGAAQWAAYSILIGMRNVSVPGCISEGCFMDSPGETWPDDAIKYGEAIGRGIERFLKGERTV